MGRNVVKLLIVLLAGAVTNHFNEAWSADFGTVISAGQVWMDRNLGTSRIATNSTDSESYGDLYQWGRGTDGHEKRTSLTTTVRSSIDIPGHGLFIKPLSQSWDWRAPQNANLLQGVSGINNLCPPYCGKVKS